MKDLFDWLERKLWIGEVVRDYGCLSEHKAGGVLYRTSLLLCRRRGELQLVIKTAGSAFLTASVKYDYLPASVALRLREIAEDIEAHRQ